MSASGLVVPAARQGPGTMPAAAVAALGARLDRLVATRVPGAATSRGTGEGTELSQLRPYGSGDDVRRIDPAASARTGTLHVRLQVPERSLTTWIVLDLSASMAFGTARRLKADVAEGVADVFARLGVRRTGSVAVVAFGPGWWAGSRVGGGELRVLAPRGARPGRVAVRRLLDEGVAPDAPAPASRNASAAERAGLATALRRTLDLARGAGLVVVVSDFREPHGWERPLGALRLRHAAVAVEVDDPAERELPAAGRLDVVDPETGRLVRADASNPRLRERFVAIETERRRRVAAELSRLAVTHVRLGTDSDWLRELGRQLR